MKNLFLVPTEQPTRLFHDVAIDKLVLTDTSEKSKWFQNFHIYITNDEEIKEGVAEWGFDIYENKIFFPVKDWKGLTKGRNKKIILTTDQKLIKYNVQAIDDEFLQWFVKNPSCEEVKVEDYGDLYNFRYLILTPKEEPKSFGDKIESFVENWKKTHLERLLKKEEFCDNCNNEICCCVIKKHETIEEIAKEVYPDNIVQLSPTFYHNTSDIRRHDFIQGYNLHNEEMYSEEEVRKLLLSQRGNCYVAILTKTRDTELASLAMSAPEPSGKDGWVKQFKK